MSGSFETSWTVAHQAPLSMAFPRQGSGVACHFHLQGNFLTQGKSSVSAGRVFTMEPPGTLVISSCIILQSSACRFGRNERSREKKVEKQKGAEVSAKHHSCLGPEPRPGSRPPMCWLVPGSLRPHPSLDTTLFSPQTQGQVTAGARRVPTTWLAVWIRPPGLSQGKGLGLGGPVGGVGPIEGRRAVQR